MVVSSEISNTIMDCIWRYLIPNLFSGCRSMLMNSPISGQSSENVVNGIMGETTLCTSQYGSSIRVSTFSAILLSGLQEYNSYAFLFQDPFRYVSCTHFWTDDIQSSAQQSTPVKSFLSVLWFVSSYIHKRIRWMLLHHKKVIICDVLLNI